MQAAKMVKCENSDKYSYALIGGGAQHTGDENLTRNNDANGKYMYVVHYYDVSMSMYGGEARLTSKAFRTYNHVHVDLQCTYPYYIMHVPCTCTCACTRSGDMYVYMYMYIYTYTCTCKYM